MIRLAHNVLPSQPPMLQGYRHGDRLWSYPGCNSGTVVGRSSDIAQPGSIRAALARSPRLVAETETTGYYQRER